MAAAVDRSRDGMETVEQIKASFEAKASTLRMQLDAARAEIERLQMRIEELEGNDEGHWVTPKDAVRILNVSQATISRQSGVWAVGSFARRKSEADGRHRAIWWMSIRIAQPAGDISSRPIKSHDPHKAGQVRVNSDRSSRTLSISQGYRNEQ